MLFEFFLTKYGKLLPEKFPLQTLLAGRSLDLLDRTTGLGKKAVLVIGISFWGL